MDETGGGGSGFENGGAGPGPAQHTMTSFHNMLNQNVKAYAPKKRKIRSPWDIMPDRHKAQEAAIHAHLADKIKYGG